MSIKFVSVQSVLFTQNILFELTIMFCPETLILIIQVISSILRIYVVFRYFFIGNFSLPVTYLFILQIQNTLQYIKQQIFPYRFIIL